jgi:hypothetical protein
MPGLNVNIHYNNAPFKDGRIRLNTISGRLLIRVKGMWGFMNL